MRLVVACRPLYALSPASFFLRFSRPSISFFSGTKSISTSAHKKMETSQTPQIPDSFSGVENSRTQLFLCAKGSSENNIAESLKKSDALKLGDERLSVSLYSETVARENSLPFQIELYLSELHADRFGRLIFWSPKMSSTQDLVSQNFCELPLGAVCVADVQVKGRGRSKNVWESPPGCLLFSFTLQMEDGRVVPLLQYVVSLSMTETIKSVCDAKGLPYVDVKIKWPNDLYLNGLKVGGILCTSTYKSKKFNICAGVGLNVDNEKPTTCLNKVLKQYNCESVLRREEILAAFFNKFEHFFDILTNQGFQALEELYYKSWLHSGQKVLVEERNGEQLVDNIPVTIEGLTSSGYLLAIGEDGKYYELHPDGNSFDFFKGLVQRKLEAR
ncbi:hypothetical protein H6P81_017600 [Aristolochia fimbriata]|uniref:BPL/LPL catalytic domain-containing protein n=1 Tax=Aristolochia fimbriata TaxID=158543 RepID=A0AAV7E1I0_ARIFI|nr:hypothetical protein H6P81_017600 [Aristolochia fimbriata]